jgi:membrane protein required for colicin V production
MHTLDIIIAVISLFFLILGIKRGLIGEIIRLLAMASGFIVGFFYYEDFSPYLQVIRVPSNIRNAISFVILYVCAALLVLGIGWLIKKAVHLTPLGIIDRILGGLVGLLKAMMIAWVVCLSISSFTAKKFQSDFSRSVMYSTFKKLPPVLTLGSITDAQKTIKNILSKGPDLDINEAGKKIKHFHQVIDSAKLAEKPAEK